MVYLKEIIEITGENLVNGNLEQKIIHYSTANEISVPQTFYIPIQFRGKNKEKYILDNVKKDSIKIEKYSLKDARDIKETDKEIEFTTKIYEKKTFFSHNLYGLHLSLIHISEPTRL